MGFLIGASGAAADTSTRAAVIAGSMLAVLAALVSLAWALYKFKPGVIGAGVGPPSAGGGAAAAQGNQETPLLLPASAALNEQSAAGDDTPTQVQTTDVDLAQYFSPMSTTTTVNRGVQADVDFGVAGWTASSALAARSSLQEVSKSQSGGLSVGGGAGTGTTMNVGTQTVNLQTVDMTDHAPAAPATGAAAVHSTVYSRTATDTTRDTIQVCRSVFSCLQDFHC